jgi:hypothetical protein
VVRRRSDQGGTGHGVQGRRHLQRLFIQRLFYFKKLLKKGNETYKSLVLYLIVFYYEVNYFLENCFVF